MGKKVFSKGLELSILVLIIGLSVFSVVSPFVSASHDDNNNDDDECGLSNIGACVMEKLGDFILKIFSAPIEFLVDLFYSLIKEPVDISLFNDVWRIIVYAISLLYGILFLYSGFNFIVSGHDIGKREKAKNSFRNLVIMILVLQASYFIYEIALQLNLGLTEGVLSLVKDNFLLLNFDDFSNSFLSIFYGIPYALILLLTVLFLTIRYLIVASGITFFPIGIFLYFFSPLKNYGGFIISFLAGNIFVTFFSAIILLIFSKLLEVDFYDNMKIILSISSLLLIDVLIFFISFFSIIKSALNVGSKVISQTRMVSKLLK